jgi:hypothetical protein
MPGAENTNSNIQAGDPTVPPELGYLIVERQLFAGHNLSNYDYIGENQLASWINTTRACLVKAFGSNSRNIEDFLAFGEDYARSFSRRWVRKQLSRKAFEEQADGP